MALPYERMEQTTSIIPSFVSNVLVSRVIPQFSFIIYHTVMVTVLYANLEGVAEAWTERATTSSGE